MWIVRILLKRTGVKFSKPLFAALIFCCPHLLSFLAASSTCTVTDTKLVFYGDIFDENESIKQRKKLIKSENKTLGNLQRPFEMSIDEPVTDGCRQSGYKDRIKHSRRQKCSGMTSQSGIIYKWNQWGQQGRHSVLSWDGWKKPTLCEGHVALATVCWHGIYVAIQWRLRRRQSLLLTQG